MELSRNAKYTLDRSDFYFSEATRVGEGDKATILQEAQFVLLRGLLVEVAELREELARAKKGP